ncbi:MAG: recombinase family protein [Anaerotignum propionicum]|uniref:recombinase family protein n=1 Tax=Anaerotignum propionicum TaxID=28446 RepID=UPI002B1EDDFC|nr:recombinase family protein [Anaerotignum propionicum]MEA5056075.1 recombinase family protein [Anaerotignum propionicum]
MIYIYARQSIDKKDSISIETQIEYAKREVFNEEFKIYEDKGYSGKNTNRPAFEQMMKDMDIEEVSKVVVYRLDRVSRSIVDFGDFINSLEEKGVSFVSATEKFDTSTPMGRAMLYIVIVFAQLERETIAERVKDNYYARVRKGAWGGGPAAYGFNLVRTVIDGKKATSYQANDQLANVVKIFELYRQQYTSLADVQRFLVSEGILSAGGVNFDSTKLSSILKNPAYVKADIAIYNFYKSKGAIMANDVEEFDGVHGCILVGKRDGNERKYKDVSEHLLAIGTHDGIIDSQTFLACQTKLASNRQIKNTYKGKYSWLTGLVKCGYCGYSFSVRFGAVKEGRIPYFACSGRYLHKSCDAIQTHRVYDVEAFVENQLVNEAENIRLRNENTENHNQKDQNKKLMLIEEKINNLILSLENASSVTAEYINSRIEALHQEKQDIMKSFTHIPQKQNEIANFSDFDWENLSIEEKNKVARSFIEKVILTKNNVEIVFK